MYEEKTLFNKYQNNVPFVGDLIDKTKKVAQDQRYVKTLLKRRCRFDKWEPNTFNRKMGNMGTRGDMEKKLYDEFREISKNASLDVLKNYKMALSHPDPEVSGLRRAMTYKALNKLIQGSAADMTKLAMCKLYKEGIIPHIQIHDELDISVKPGDEKKIIEIMQNAVKLAIPNKVDFKSGKTWGDIYD